jgi:hypothetical protein
MFDSRNHALKLPEDKKLTLLDSVNKVIKDNLDIFSYRELVPFRYWMLYVEKIRPIWDPSHTRIRKAIPRKWMDLSSLIETVNFEFIKSFYEEEYIDGIVDWEGSGEKHIEFARWLESAYQYITVLRPDLEKQLDEAYPPTRPIEEWFEESEETYKGEKLFKFIPSNNDYSEVNRIEKLIEDTDTKLLTELIQYRTFFWS